MRVEKKEGVDGGKTAHTLVYKSLANDGKASAVVLDTITTGVSGVFVLPEGLLVQHSILALQGVASSLALLEAGCIRGPSLRPSVTTAALEEVAAAARARLSVERAVELLLAPNGPPEETTAGLVSAVAPEGGPGRGGPRSRGPVTRAFASAVRAVLLATSQEARQLDAAVMAARKRSAAVVAQGAYPVLGRVANVASPPTLLELLRCSQGMRGQLLVLEGLCGCDSVEVVEPSQPGWCC